MYIKFNISDLLSEEAFCRLQAKFIGYDTSGNEDVVIHKPIQSLSIKYEEKDDFGYIIDYLELDFFNDFLIPEIQKMAGNMFRIFQNMCSTLYTNDTRSGYAKQYMDKIRGAKSTLQQVGYLPKEIKEEVIFQLEELEELVDKYTNDPYPNIKEKIQFKMNRTDVVFLFHQLREGEIISHIEDRDLGKILDYFCQCYDVPSDTYRDIVDSRKLLNNFKNQSRPDNKPLERLKSYLATL